MPKPRKQEVGATGKPGKASKKKDTPAPAKSTKVSAEDRAAALAWAHEQVARLVPGTRPCGCGCGEQVKGRFRPGHDATLVSRLLQERLATVAAA